jgi:hypothetical protein
LRPGALAADRQVRLPGGNEHETQHPTDPSPAARHAGAAAAVPVGAAAPPEQAQDLCLISPTGGGSFNTFIIRMCRRSPGKVVLMHGMYFNGTQRPLRFGQRRDVG